MKKVEEGKLVEMHNNIPMKRLILPFQAIAVALIAFASCTGPKQPLPTKPPIEMYSRQLAPGESALIPVVLRRDLPDLKAAWDSKDVFLFDAIKNSIAWFKKPSSQQWFPMEEITHKRAFDSVIQMQNLLTNTTSAIEFENRVIDEFEIYQSRGHDGTGSVLFTGYYSPVFDASPIKTNRFTAPLYKRPLDLVTDPLSGLPIGRRMPDDSITKNPTRREYIKNNILYGNELIWVENSLNAYTIQVNGSARLKMPNNTYQHIGYAGKTEHPYTGLGETLLRKNIITKKDLSLRKIKRLYKEKPEIIENAILENDNFVFFQEYDGNSWPAGSLGVPVTSERTLATDKDIFPRGGIVMAETTVKNFSGQSVEFRQLMVDQDTGGAINAPGRADIYFGIGALNELKAGQQFALGRLYYFFIRD